ncbi:transmembrane protein, putative [Medicago truncatula]|uniref:Transmembrane protein, putative n=1 Tax=Medicago truncatula TaxID=3880 RepID=G7KEL6_MEDTR|nr:transmembrane protein, putative [Medicago truncatula]
MASKSILGFITLFLLTLCITSSIHRIRQTSDYNFPNTRVDAYEKTLNVLGSRKMLVGVDRFSLITRQHGSTGGLRVLHNCYIDSVGSEDKSQIGEVKMQLQIYCKTTKTLSDHKAINRSKVLGGEHPFALRMRQHGYTGGLKMLHHCYIDSIGQENKSDELKMEAQIHCITEKTSLGMKATM